MEELKGDQKTNMEIDGKPDEIYTGVDKPTKPNYDDVVLVSQPTLSSKSTLPPDTLELR